MEKIHKITEQLENKGALNTEGHGSMYKGRRIGEIFTAVKMLPGQVQTESPKDKNFIYFQHEIARLKKVNEQPNPHVTRFLSSGISEAGRMPFVEMDFIHGPDLEQVQQAPHDAIFTTTEVLKIAGQLSNALAHWHRAGVKHGNVKSRNVKFNVHTGDYVLVNFGWSGSADPGLVLKNPVAAESFAPEQKNGLTLFQTDVYHFGVILFKLLAGNFVGSEEDKNNKNNAAVTAYLQTPPLEFLALRKKNTPSSWPDDKQQREINVPEWLILTIYKCLEKNPENRFDNGMQLHRHIEDHLLVSKINENGGTSGNAGQQSKLPVTEREEWKLSLEKEKHFYRILHGQWKELNESVTLKDKEIQELKQKLSAFSKQGGLRRLAGNKSALNIFLSVAIFSGVITAYLMFSHNADNKPAPKISSVTKPDTGISQRPHLNQYKDIKPEPVEVPSQNDTIVSLPPATVPTITKSVNTAERETEPQEKDPVVAEEPSTEILHPETDNSLGRYKVRSKAYFYNEPDETTRRNAFIIHWNNAILTPLGDRDGFVYIVFTNHLGQTSRGWLRKKDLNRVAL